MAVHVLEDAYATGRIRRRAAIAEATSGNTGIAIVAAGRALGHAVRICMPDWMSRERVLVRGRLGAVGFRSGATLLGALQVALDQGPRAQVATVFADPNKEHLSTDLCREEPEREDDLGPEVELLGCEVVAGR